MYGIIYKATCQTNGKVYIGQTVKSLYTRRANHKFMALKGDRRTVFQLALLLDGLDNFRWEIIDTADTQEELDEKEKRWIAHYDSMNPAKGYNSTDGGYSFHASAETCRKMSEAKSGENHPNFGKHLSPETRQKLSKANKGKTLTAEHRQKLSAAKKGEKSPTAKLTEAKVREIKIALRDGTRNCDIARKYDVSDSIVRGIRAGRTWKHLQVAP